MKTRRRAKEAQSEKGKRPYKKPTLEKREKLSQVAAYTTPPGEPNTYPD